MNYEQYLSLIQGLESYAATNRRGYELRVFGLTLLGYGYFVGMILLFLAIPFAALILFIISPKMILQVLWLTAKLWWVIVPALLFFFGFLGTSVKAIFSSVPEPEERELKPDEAPELVNFVKETCKKLEAKMPDKIFLSDNFNAAVLTMPRFGIFGRKVFLQLGIPVMKALSPEQLQAVIAHEIGHVSGKHGGFGKWAYQLHDAWGRLIESQELDDNRFAFLYQKFVNWFFPYFQAYSFVLMREHEKEADEYAVQIAGAKPLGESLIVLETVSANLNKNFWASVHEENISSSSPSKNIFSRMLTAINFIDDQNSKQTISNVMKIPTDYNDTHPALADRLRLIGFWDGNGEPEVPALPELTAAEFYFGNKLENIIAEFEVKWDEDIASQWHNRYEHFQESQKRFQELEDKTSDGLTAEEILEKAQLVAEKQGNTLAIPILRQAYEAYPQNPEVIYSLGYALLLEDDETGIELLHDAIELDENCKYAASNLIFQFLRGKGRFDEAKKYASIVEAGEQDYQNAVHERQNVLAQDDFIPHNFPAESVETIISKLKYYDEINALYLVRKDVQYMKKSDCTVLFIDIRKPGILNRKNDLKPDDLLNAVTDRLKDVDIAFYAVMHGDYAMLKPRFNEMEGAKIYVKQD